MSKSVIVPANDRVIVVDHPRTTVLDGIEMPDNERQQEMAFGTVIFTGPKVSEYTKPEDQVCYGPYAGKIVVMNGVAFRLLNEGQIEAYIRKTE
jgi:co-chaperonin GroES (HSP10)